MTFFAKQLHIFNKEWIFDSPSFQTAESPCWVVEDIPMGWSTVIPIDNVCWPVLTDFQAGSVFDIGMQDQIISTANGFYDSQATEIEFFIEFVDGIPYFGIDWTGVPSVSDELEVRFATGASAYTQKRIGIPHDTTFPAGERTLAPYPLEVWIPDGDNLRGYEFLKIESFRAGQGDNIFQASFRQRDSRKSFEYLEPGSSVRSSGQPFNSFEDFFRGSEQVFVAEDLESVHGEETSWRKTADWTAMEALISDEGNDTYRVTFDLEAVV